MSSPWYLDGGSLAFHKCRRCGMYISAVDGKASPLAYSRFHDVDDTWQLEGQKKCRRTDVLRGWW